MDYIRKINENFNNQPIYTIDMNLLSSMTYVEDRKFYIVSFNKEERDPEIMSVGLNKASSMILGERNSVVIVNESGTKIPGSIKDRVRMININDSDLNSFSDTMVGSCEIFKLG